MIRVRKRSAALVAAWLLVAGWAIFPPGHVAEGPSFLLRERWSPALSAPLPVDCMSPTRSSLVTIVRLERDMFVRSLRTGRLQRVVRASPLVHYKRIDRCYTRSDAASFLSSLFALTAAFGALFWGGRSVARSLRAARSGDSPPCPPKSAA